MISFCGVKQVATINNLPFDKILRFTVSVTSSTQSFDIYRHCAPLHVYMPTYLQECTIHILYISICFRSLNLAPFERAFLSPLRSPASAADWSTASLLFRPGLPPLLKIKAHQLFSRSVFFSNPDSVLTVFMCIVRRVYLFHMGIGGNLTERDINSSIIYSLIIVL